MKSLCKTMDLHRVPPLLQHIHSCTYSTSTQTFLDVALLDKASLGYCARDRTIPSLNTSSEVTYRSVPLRSKAIGQVIMCGLHLTEVARTYRTWSGQNLSGPKPIRTEPIKAETYRDETYRDDTYRDKTYRGRNLSGRNLSGQNLSVPKLIGTKPVGTYLSAGTKPIRTKPVCT
jgi:hypothetical protein